MRKFSVLILFYLISFSVLASAKENSLYQSVDDTGIIIQLKKPAQRIISLAPDITEILFVIGAGDKIVGVIAGSDYPVAAKKIPVVGSYNGIDLERILTLKPDLIIAWQHTFSGQLDNLKKLNIPIYITWPHKLNDVSRSIIHLGELTGLQNSAMQAKYQYETRLQKLKAKFQEKKIINVFYQIGAYSLLTINKESWINEAIKLCGGKNIFSEASFLVPEVSWEAVIAANPQIIISDTKAKNWHKRWQQWPQIAAVKNNFLFTIDADLLSRAGPRLIQGVERMCFILETARARLYIS